MIGTLLDYTATSFVSFCQSLVHKICPRSLTTRIEMIPNLQYQRHCSLPMPLLQRTSETPTHLLFLSCFTHQCPSRYHYLRALHQAMLGYINSHPALESSYTAASINGSTIQPNCLLYNQDLHCTITSTTINPRSSCKRTRTNHMASSRQRLHHHLLDQCCLYTLDQTQISNLRARKASHLPHSHSSLLVLQKHMERPQRRSTQG
jgi:hypothetical protein